LNLVEEAEAEIEYDADLQAKYPCPESLEFVKHLMYTQVTIVGSNSLCLFNGATEKTGFRTRKFAEDQCKWIMLPLSDGSIILRSVLDGKNLSIWCEKGPISGNGWGHVKDTCEGSLERFNI
jgi:tRNA A37 N6-isopentenylltransferase MiaA